VNVSRLPAEAASAQAGYPLIVGTGVSMSMLTAKTRRSKGYAKSSLRNLSFHCALEVNMPSPHTHTTFNN
jgi:hypothetical protein